MSRMRARERGPLVRTPACAPDREHRARPFPEAHGDQRRGDRLAPLATAVAGSRAGGSD
jgi:hypothetical protein